MKLKIRNPISEKGIVSLGTTILLGGIIVEIALAIALVVYVLNQSSFGARLSAQALANAHSGVEEGFLRVIRGDFPTAFDFPQINPVAEVVICIPGDCDGITDPNKRVIASTGLAQSKRRTLFSVVGLDPLTKLMSIESVKEIENP